jgi:hypothetical protein
MRGFAFLHLTSAVKISLVNALNEPGFAWEPVTPRGVAAFARASFERLLVVQSIFALLATVAVLWVLNSGFFPTVSDAVNQLPESGDITRGRLNWTGDSPKLLAEGHFLAFSVDLQHSGQMRSPAQFQFEFGENSVWILSLFGMTEVDYPTDQSFYFSRPGVQPAWGAWAPEALGLAAVGTFFGLLLSWTLLATIYFLPVWLISFFANREVNFRQSWKLSGAALMPGAMLMTLSIVLYGAGVFDLVKLCFAMGMHLLIGWIYLFISPLCLNRAVPAEKGNPFGSPGKN